MPQKRDSIFRYLAGAPFALAILSRPSAEPYRAGKDISAEKKDRWEGKIHLVDRQKRLARLAVGYSICLVKETRILGGGKNRREREQSRGHRGRKKLMSAGRTMTLFGG
jgi:hypothetical protein